MTIETCDSFDLPDIANTVRAFTYAIAGTPPNMENFFREFPLHAVIYSACWDYRWTLRQRGAIKRANEKVDVIPLSLSLSLSFYMYIKKKKEKENRVEEEKDNDEEEIWTRGRRELR